MTSPTEGAVRPRALVVGTGLIGGSIALGLRQRGWHVAGLDADQARTAQALEAGVIDAVGDDLAAEIVFVATPALSVAEVVRSVLEDAGRRTDAVVTDVSGVKTAIVEGADHPRFIGGHPMAGSEQIGLTGADPDLFEGAAWVLTPTAATDLEAFTRLQAVVTALGADVIVLSPADHDRLVAMVSHVPHLVAATLMNAAAVGAEHDGALLRLAAGGFRDMTRVAAGHPGIWPDICAENAGPIVGALDALVADLTVMRDRVANQDRSGMLEVLGQASAARRNLPAQAVRPERLSELRVPVPDRQGVLAEITSLAADAGISIYDIEIAHSAEGPRGVLILVVDRDRAETLRDAITAQGYRCRAEQLSWTAPRILVVHGGVPCVGAVRTPGEKSISHRSVLLAALAEGTSVVHGLSDGADVAASLAAVEAMGAGVERRDDGAVVLHGGRDRLHQPAQPLECGNSGTSMRLLTGLVAGLPWATELIGDESLSTRPMDRVAEPLTEMGATVRGGGERCLPPVRIEGGGLHGIDWTSKVPSAQVKSAILLAGLSAQGPTTVREAVTTRTHTEEMLAQAGVDVAVEPWGEGRVVTVQPGPLQPVERTVPGDPSAAAFFVVAGCVVEGSEISVTEVYDGPARLGFVSVLQRMGGQVTVIPEQAGTATIRSRFGQLRGTTVEAAEIPSLDEIPALAVAAAVAEGTTVFHDVGELRIKEVDRLAAVIEMVQAFGANASAEGDTLTITGVGPVGRLHGARIDSQGDHRMAMASTVAGLAAPSGQRSLITGFAAVATSYPTFAQHLRALTVGAPLADQPRPLLIAIDGPAGAGKSTLSRAVAARLGLERLDTGAMYRAVAALALRDGVAPDDVAAVAALAREATIAVGATVAINGYEVTDLIRSPEVGQAVSLVAANAEVRAELVLRQRAWVAEHGGGVVEGRDIGTVVFPNAAIKIYLTATPEERARRRRDETAAGVARRDHLDSTRAASPLTEAPDAHLLDTTQRGVQDVVEEVLSWL